MNLAECVKDCVCNCCCPTPTCCPTMYVSFDCGGCCNGGNFICTCPECDIMPKEWNIETLGVSLLCPGDPNNYLSALNRPWTLVYGEGICPFADGVECTVYFNCLGPTCCATTSCCFGAIDGDNPTVGVVLFYDTVHAEWRLFAFDGGNTVLLRSSEPFNCCDINQFDELVVAGIGNPPACEGGADPEFFYSIVTVTPANYCDGFVCVDCCDNPLPDTLYADYSNNGVVQLTYNPLNGSWESSEVGSCIEVDGCFWPSTFGGEIQFETDPASCETSPPECCPSGTPIGSLVNVNFIYEAANNWWHAEFLIDGICPNNFYLRNNAGTWELSGDSTTWFNIDADVTCTLLTLNSGTAGFNFFCDIPGCFWNFSGEISITECTPVEGLILSCPNGLCDHCSEEPSPKQWQVTFAGFDDGVCPCSKYNGTWTLNYSNEFNNGVDWGYDAGCFWRVASPETDIYMNFGYSTVDSQWILQTGLLSNPGTCQTYGSYVTGDDSCVDPMVLYNILASELCSEGSPDNVTITPLNSNNCIFSLNTGEQLIDCNCDPFYLIFQGDGYIINISKNTPMAFNMFALGTPSVCSTISCITNVVTLTGFNTCFTIESNQIKTVGSGYVCGSLSVPSTIECNYALLINNDPASCISVSDNTVISVSILSDNINCCTCCDGVIINPCNANMNPFIENDGVIYLSHQFLRDNLLARIK